MNLSVKTKISARILAQQPNCTTLTNVGATHYALRCRMRTTNRSKSFWRAMTQDYFTPNILQFRWHTDEIWLIYAVFSIPIQLLSYRM